MQEPGLGHGHVLHKRARRKITRKEQMKSASPCYPCLFSDMGHNYFFLGGVIVSELTCFTLSNIDWQLSCIVHKKTRGLIYHRIVQ